MFSKKIKCSSCGKNFKGIKERNKEKYICSSYSNYGKCIRQVIEQNRIVYLVANHLEIDKVKTGVGTSGSKMTLRTKVEDYDQITLEQVMNSVKQINIDPINKTIEILYNDNTRTFVSDDQIYF
ncbi:zinc ribbon domain-containing protein [Paenibacillus pini]|nr:zinc ribbon domain-containing protein [Paenibacillus pini]